MEQPRETHNPFYAQIYGEAHNVVYVAPDKEKIISMLSKWFSEHRSFINIVHHPDYSAFRERQVLYDGGVCALLEKLYPVCHGMKHISADFFKEVLPRHLPFLKLHFKLLFHSLKTVERYWNANISAFENTLANFFVRHHKILLCVDSKHYPRFKRAVDSRCGAAFTLLERLRFPYENVTDEESTFEFFINTIHELNQQNQLGELSSNSVNDVSEVNRLWQMYCAQHKRKKILQRVQRSVKRELEQDTDLAIRSVIDLAEVQPPVAAGQRRRGLFFADMPEEEGVETVVGEFKAPYPVKKLKL